MTHTVPCIHCGEDVELNHIRETHKVHNGIGLQTVGYDEYTEIVDQDCDCELDTYDLDDMIDHAIVEEENSRQDYGDDRYHELKEEGRL